MQEKLLLNQARNLDSDKSGTTLKIDLTGNRDIIVDGNFNETVNQYNVYLDEREACTTVRLTAKVNLIASNVLFNSVTEVVKNEGSSDSICLNYQPQIIQSSIGKPGIAGENKPYLWGSNMTEMMQDTQVTFDGDDMKNYTYLCGIDIFDNPILRSNTKYLTYINGVTDYNYNTIKEISRDQFGGKRSIYYYVNPEKHEKYAQHFPIHDTSNTYDFFVSIKNNLIERNGWLGFVNKTKVFSDNYDNTNVNGTERVINNKNTYSFINMFPGYDRYSLIPHYNKYKDRYEKNWEYCLTYPCSSTTENIPFIDKNLDTLKIAFISENSQDDDDVYRCTIYSVSKHGLNVDDTINLYRTTEDGTDSKLVEGSLVVDSIIDDYTFTVYTSNWVCDKWLSVFDKDGFEYYNVTGSGDVYFVEAVAYDFSDSENKWRYNPTTENDFIEVDISQEQSKITRKEYSIDNYINIDYDLKYTLYGEKYFPYCRFVKWLDGFKHYLKLYIKKNSTYFIDNYTYFLIDAEYNSKEKIWIPNNEALAKAQIAVSNCQPSDILSGLTEYRTEDALGFLYEELSGWSDIGYSTDTSEWTGGMEYFKDIEEVYLTGDNYVYIVEFAGSESVDDYLSNHASEQSLNVVYHWLEHLDGKYKEHDITFCREKLNSALDNYFNGEPVESLSGEYVFEATYNDGHTTITDNIQNGYELFVTKEENPSHIGSKNLSFAKVVDGVQCKYYVRIMSRFPNFDFYDKEITEENIYSRYDGSGISVIDEYSKLEHEKQSTLTRLGFSKNIYGDDMCQIVYNDDIDIDVIKDNLGRPLTSLYLSFFKTNYGYKDWYQKSISADTGNDVFNEVPDYRNDDIEWSRCFGKLNCGFEYSPHIHNEDTLGVEYPYGCDGGFANVHVMNNLFDGTNNNVGLTETPFGGGDEEGEDVYNRISKINTYINQDEIMYKKQDKFYGDLCMYSPAECLETSIQDCCHRFNTAQRELGGRMAQNQLSTISGFTKVQFSVITSDVIKNSNVTNWVIQEDYDLNPTKHPEGYYYHPNYEIPIRTFSTEISEFSPKMIDIISIDDTGENNVLKLSAATETYFNKSANIYIYDSNNGKSYHCELVNLLDTNVLSVIPDEPITINDPYGYKIYNRNVAIPDYAEMIPEGSGIYRWRELIQNGFETTEGLIPEYPFVNGCLYVNKDINIFLKRQDPFGRYGLSHNGVAPGFDILEGVRNPVEDGTAGNTNDAINESNARC